MIRQIPTACAQLRTLGQAGLANRVAASRRSRRNCAFSLAAVSARGVLLPTTMSRVNACIEAAFFWLSLEIAAGRPVDLEAHLAFCEWTLRDVPSPIRC